MNYCQKQHERSSCGYTPAVAAKNGKLIDCVERRLCDDQGQPYACLSYVWGVGTTGQQTESSTFPNGIPQTVLDAILVTHKIGIRYLWVDRYAIDQGDEEEKHRIICNMAGICEAGYGRLIRLLLLILEWRA